MKRKAFHLLAVVLLLAGGCGRRPLLEKVTVAPTTITPNADGTTDLAKMSFLLNESATVTIALYDEEGTRYIFRPPARLALSEDPYTVYFGGVVEGYTRPGEAFDYAVRRRMLPDGPYTWEITAVPDEGTPAVVTGTLAIRDADTRLPGIRHLTLSPRVFSPNQDGIDDVVTIRLELEKDVEELLVYLEGPDGTSRPIPESEGEVPPNARGWHIFRYDGGIDAGHEPPPDGLYTLRAEARDSMGQYVVVSDTLEIVNAGLPMAYIVNGDVSYAAVSLVLSDTLCYTLTVENDSETYLRTTGPWPGTTYRSDENFNTLGWPEAKGVFRVGMDYDTSLRNYPFRWGLGRPGVELVTIGQHWYLPPRARSVVTGCVQIVEVPKRNPLYYWMGLLHEGMATPPVNNRVAPHFVTIWEP